MTVTLRAASTPVAAAAAAPQTATPTLPTGTATGDRVFVMASTEPSSGTQPSLSANGTGWTLLYSTAPGSVRLSCWYRDKDASWSTMPTVSNSAGTSTTNAMIVGALALQKTGSTWDTPTFVTGADTTSATSFSATGSGNLGVTTGNYMFALCGTSGNSTATAHSLTATGATLASPAELADLGSSNGGGVGFKIFGAAVTAGTSTAAPVVSCTLSGANTGSVYFIRQTDSSVAAPVANAGADVASHTVNTAFTRTGSGTNSPTSYAWTIQSGPTGVGSTIGSAAALSWTPTVAGTYVLNLAATNAGGTGSDTLSITVVAAGGGTVDYPDPVIVRSGDNIATVATETNAAWPVSLGANAAAGNLLVYCFAGDKNTGTMTMSDNIGSSGWTVEVSIPGASTSLYIAWKVAVGGENTITGTISSTSISGNNAWAAEISQDGSANWGVCAESVPTYTDATSNTRSTGTTPASTFKGLAIAACAVDSYSNASGGSWSNGYVSTYSPGTQVGDTGGAPVHVGRAVIAKGDTTETTFSKTPTATADQMTAAVVVFGRQGQDTAAPAATTRGGFFPFMYG